MGCGSSKPQTGGETPRQAAATDDTAPEIAEFRPVDAPVAAATSAFPPVASPPPGPAPPPEEDQGLVWNLDEDEIGSLHTVKLLERIKDAAASEFGIPKSRVALIDTTKGWFFTTTGAFSPANLMPGSVPYDQYLQYQRHAAPSTPPNPVLTIPDMTKVPEYRDRPAVKHRPHLTFRSGLLLVSPLSDPPHPLGYIFVWDSQPHPDFTPEQDARFQGYAARCVAAMQRSLLKGVGVGVGPPGAPLEDLSGVKVELPAVWIDFNSPLWRVVGINDGWERLTGVGLEALEAAGGLLGVLGHAEGAADADFKATLRAAEAEVPPGRSVPAILSPRSPAGASLQFAVGARRAPRPPPRPAPAVGSAFGAAGEEVWLLEVHVRVQADTHSGEHLSISPLSFGGVASDAGGGGSGGPGTGGSGGRGSGGGGRGSGGRGSGGQTSSSSGGRGSTGAGAAAGVPPRMATLRFGDVLGSGSYADVYSGTFGSRPVAIKVIEIPDTGTGQIDWGAHYEALMAVDIRHPNIVRTFDWCRIDQEGRGWAVWIVQELCDAGGLRQAALGGRLREGAGPDAPPDLRAILETALEVARAMRYLHRAGEVHADLSANNVLLCSADNARGFVAKVTDFGLSKLGSSVHTSKTYGTVTYMPPELLLEGSMGPPGDVYAFGVILWEMWAGRAAWAGMNQHQVVFAVSCLEQKLEWGEETPPRYAALAGRCMATDPAERPTFEEVAEELKDMLGEASMELTEA